MKNLTYEDYDPEKLYLYAGLDCLVTSGIARKLYPQIVSKPDYHYVLDGKKSTRPRISTLNTIKGLQIPALNFMIDMECNGIKYDIERNRRINSRMVEEIEALDDSIYTAIGSEIDQDSSVAVSEFLYGTQGFEILSRTNKGEASVDGDALLGLHEKYGHEYLKLMAKRKDIISCWRTFVKDYITDFVKRDGKIHPQYNLHGTSSFRITGDNPNLTQLPRPKHNYNIRECFMVEEGYFFLALDFSSCEVKVLGALSKDPVLLRAIQEGLDFHSFSASKMLGIPYQEFIDVLKDASSPLYKTYKGYRQFAKALTFGILYGSSPSGIARNIGCTLAKATELIDLYFKTYPRIKTYVEDTHNMAKLNHYVLNEFGQIKHEYGTIKSLFGNTAVYNAALRNAQNVRVQSTASMLGLFCFIALNEEIKRKRGKTLCTVYDSIEIESPIVRGAEIIETAFYYMDDYPVEQLDWLDLPIGVEAEVGYNWGKMVPIHRGITQGELENILTELKEENNDRLH